MNFDLEELQLDEELEDIFRCQTGFRFDFPVISVGGHHMYFNSISSDLIKDVKYVTIQTSPSYVIIRPAARLSTNAFTLTNTNTSVRAVVIPASLEEKKLKKAVYKLYKYKDGWAFKRYEPIEGSSR